ncbi:MAG: hypothetical protein O3B95_04095 [Chloroflexi bacterium]|nr:hypothetical protein [Chloroflexota bacterium]
MAEPRPDNERRGVTPRRNIVAGSSLSFRKRHETTAYLVLLAIVLLLVIWFLIASISGGGKADDAEATAIATLFAPETAVAAELTETAR